MLKRYPIFTASLISAACISVATAATPIDLSHQSIAALSSLRAAGSTSVKEISRDTDFQQTTHIRVQQMYAGYPVLGGDAIVHVPKGGNASLANLRQGTTMNGLFYQGLTADLRSAPPVAQADAVTEHAIGLYQKKSGNQQNVENKTAQLMVFPDENHKAHWVYVVSFLVQPSASRPEKPTYIIDAQNYKVYAQWDDIKTLESTMGGGFGGNVKAGKVSYDGLTNDLPQLTMMRDANSGTCYLQNADVTVLDARHKDSVAQFACKEVASEHNNIYWSGDFDQVNGAYSPANDALFFGGVVRDLYKNWFSEAVLTEDGKPMQLTMRVHAPDPQTGAPAYENAYWDGKQMSFGDGQSMFYPLVSLGVAAHEISHGFTQQHSNLWYFWQAGGLNESFSDMAAQAAEYYAYGKNNWQIGPEIFKAKDKALRYMDEPTKDCEGRTPGDRCSIDKAEGMGPGPFLNVHYSSGVFNKVFYLMSTSPNWNTKKAFEVMVEANKHYWTSLASFGSAGCGVLTATKKLSYDKETVEKALHAVGLETSYCS